MRQCVQLTLRFGVDRLFIESGGMERGVQMKRLKHWRMKMLMWYVRNNASVEAVKRMKTTGRSAEGLSAALDQMIVWRTHIPVTKRI